MKFKKTILPSGIRLIEVPKEGSQAVTVLVLVEAGSKHETKEINGISHFLEHICFKGTKKRPRAIDISSELDALGSQYNAFTAQEYTGYYATVWPKHFENIVDILADMYLNPSFEEAEIEKEKGVIVEEINMYEDNPSHRASDLFMELVYGDQPAGWNILGTKETVKTINRQNFIDYRDKHYVGEATTIIVAGSYDKDTLAKLIEQKFGNISTTEKEGRLPVVERQTQPEILVKHRKSDQTHMIIGFRAYDANDERGYATDILSTILGGSMSSRLFQRIREEMGAAYYVRTLNDAYSDHGYLSIAVGADNKRVKEVISVILEECKKLVEKVVSPKELQLVKDYLIGNLHLDLETSSQLAFYYGMQEVLHKPLLTPKEYVAKLEAVTALEVKQVAQDIFQNHKLNLALIGPFEDRAEFAGLFQI